MSLCRMYTEEGRDHFTVRDNVLGHSQQGGTPTTFDRNMSTKLAARTVHWLTEQLNHLASLDGKDRERWLEMIDNSCQGTVHAEEASSAVVLGLQRSVYTFQPVKDLVANTDFDKR